MPIYSIIDSTQDNYDNNIVDNITNANEYLIYTESLLTKWIEKVKNNYS